MVPLTLTMLAQTRLACGRVARVLLASPSTIVNCASTRTAFCQDASQTGSGTPSIITLNNCYVHDNGDEAPAGDTSTSGDGFTHAVYFGGGALDVVIINNSFLIGGKFTGHGDANPRRHVHGLHQHGVLWFA